MSKINAVKKLWEKVPATWKTEMVSAWHTFVAAFMAEIAMHSQSFESGDLSASLFQSVLFAALRSGVKAVFLFIYEMNSGKPFTPLKKSKD